MEKVHADESQRWKEAEWSERECRRGLGEWKKHPITSLLVYIGQDSSLSFICKTVNKIHLKVIP